MMQASFFFFAVGLGDLQRRLPADFRFRCRAIPGTQEIRTKIGHLGMWASINYGNGIFVPFPRESDAII